MLAAEELATIEDDPDASGLAIAALIAKCEFSRDNWTFPVRRWRL